MTTPNRPNDVAPGGMRGATRMHDPSEAEHDRIRRRLMNAAFVVILAATLAQFRWVSLHGWDWLSAVLLIVAGRTARLGRENLRAAIQDGRGGTSARVAGIAHAPEN